jgi:hypothetical protein
MITEICGDGDATDVEASRLSCRSREGDGCGQVLDVRPMRDHRLFREQP